MTHLVLVFLGGGAGSVLRYLVGKWIGAFAPHAAFPWGTFAVNVLGSLLIGLLATLATRGTLSAEWRLMLVVGFCGGFTTFSTFSRESLALLTGGQALTFVLYAAGSVALGLAAAWCGVKLVS